MLCSPFCLGTHQLNLAQAHIPLTALTIVYWPWYVWHHYLTCGLRLRSSEHRPYEDDLSFANHWQYHSPPHPHNTIPTAHVSHCRVYLSSRQDRPKFLQAHIKQAGQKSHWHISDAYELEMASACNSIKIRFGLQMRFNKSKSTSIQRILLSLLWSRILAG